MTVLSGESHLLPGRNRTQGGGWGAPKPARGNLGSKGTKEQAGRYAHTVPVWSVSRVPGWDLGNPAWIMGETLFSLKLKLNIIGNKMLGVRSSAGAREALLIN